MNQDLESMNTQRNKEIANKFKYSLNRVYLSYMISKLDKNQLDGYAFTIDAIAPDLGITTKFYKLLGILPRVYFKAKVKLPDDLLKLFLNEKYKLELSEL